MRSDALPIHIAAAALLGMLSPLAVAAQSTSDKTLTVARIVGTWQLVSDQFTLKDGSVVSNPKFGAHAKGFLMYEPDGHMCAEVMNPDRPAWKKPQKPTSDDKVTSFDGFLGYCGTYTLDAQRSILTHFPSVAWTPDYVGTSQSRPFHFEGEYLIITPVSNDPNIAKHVLTWKRVQ